MADEPQNIEAAAEVAMAALRNLLRLEGGIEALKAALVKEDAATKQAVVAAVPMDTTELAGKLFEKLPDGDEAKLDAVTEVYGVVREQAKVVLVDPISKLLIQYAKHKNISKDDPVKTKQNDLQKKINAVLTKAGISVQMPGQDTPTTCSVIFVASSTGNNSYLRLQSERPSIP